MIIACVFLYAPMAEAGHVESTVEISCEIDHSSDQSDRDRPDRRDHEHDHHAHHCGPCLQYILRLDQAQETFACLSKTTRLSTLSENLDSYLPGTLFRPPRA